MYRSIVFLLMTGIAGMMLSAQTIYPKMSFPEHPGNHNMHLCSDGQYLYTVNGGNSTDGKIRKYTLSGDYVTSYAMELDMRGCFFYKGDLYVSTYGADLYKVKNLYKGDANLVCENAAGTEQSAVIHIPSSDLALSWDGESIFILSMEDCEVTEVPADMMSGSSATSGSSTIAVSEYYMFTYDGYSNKVYVYNSEFELVNSVILDKGSYGFSLSFANDMLFLADDGDYGTGTWYAYSLDDLLGTSSSSSSSSSGSGLDPAVRFNESPGTHNMSICFDGDYYYTANGGVADKGVIRRYSPDFELLNEFQMKYDMRSLVVYNGYLYFTTYGGGVYKVESLWNGRASQVRSNAFDDEHPNASFYYGDKALVMDDGTVQVHDLPSWDFDSYLSYTVKHGDEAFSGRSSIAYGDGKLVTVDTDSKTFYVYKGSTLVGTYSFSQGSYAQSLSFANGYFWIAVDGNYGEGTWYGYRIP